MKTSVLYVLLMFVTLSAFPQSGINRFLKPSDSLHIQRRDALIISEASLFAVSMIGLNQLWYSDYEQSKFRTVDDSNDWLYMDKLGHSYSAYQLGRVGANMLEWSGVSEKNQLIYGATLGFTFLTAVEVFDGFSEEWGFSWSDMAANAAGTGLYVGQELLWDEQRISLKYSFHRTSFAQHRPERLGDGFIEEFLKDYNGQTYWLSVNLKSFFKRSNIPPWINVAIGYGAEGMLTGDGKAVEGKFINQNRYRQYYFSLDLDLTKINTNSHFLNTIFDVFNTVKVPFPALEFNGKNNIKLHGIYF